MKNHNRIIDLESERLFENKKTTEKDIRENQSKFYWATSLSISAHDKKTYQYIDQKDILEIGCSSGYSAKKYIQYTSKYTGLDISDEAIKEAKKLNLADATFICSDGHYLPFKNESFDCIVVNSLLHHMDLNSMIPEIKRVLSAEGKLIIREPLGINPLFNYYRKLTPYARTVDEQPFTLADLNLLKENFILYDINWFGFLNILSGFLRLKILRYCLTTSDSVLSNTPLKYLYWQISGILIKKNK